jgi:hypothetical protein
MASGGFRGGESRGFNHGYGRYGFYGPYDYGYYDYGYPDYAYNDSYYDNGSCYVVQRRVHTKHGWTHRPSQVCG